MSTYSAERYATCRSYGLCICKADAEPGKTLCKPCAERNNRGVAERRAHKIAIGMCVNCGKTEPAENHSSCESCIAHKRNSVHKRKDSLRAKGRCIRCGGVLDTFGKDTCGKHTSNCVENRRERRKKRREEGKCILCGQVNDTPSFYICLCCRKERRDRRSVQKKAGRISI